MGEQKVKKCPLCGRTYGQMLSFCLDDGQRLAPLDPLIGQVLDGRYQIDSVLGEGGMGTVYRATHVHIDAEFAVKVLNAELVANKDAIERFRREARAAGRIRHPNAVQVTDFDVTPQGIVYLVMELVEGRTLRELLFAEQPLNLHRANDLMSQICGAVEAAHQSGVIHRDLKPDNILVKEVSEAEIIKVCDFGIAKLKETSSLAKASPALTREGTIMGTPEYMSPEQCLGRPLDLRSDIYSLGAIFYEMICGHVPFTAETPMGIVAKHIKESPPSLLELCPALPPAVAQVVMRTLEKEPERRQSSAAELRTDLYAAIEASGAPSRSRETMLNSSRPLPTPSGFAAPNSLASGGQPRYAVETNQMSPADLSFPPRSLETEVVRVRRLPLPTWLAVTLGAVLIALLGLGGYFGWRALRGAAISERQRVQPPQLTPSPPAGMVFIPGGKFRMGRQDVSEASRRQDGPQEGWPSYEATLKPFFIDQFEITNQQYQKFIQATGRPAPAHWKNGAPAFDEATRPVTFVTWQDAMAYAKWANKRLPTEEEWEYVARGSKGWLYPWGDQWQEEYANVGHPERQRPAPVHSFERDQSPFGGVYDLAGNVSEWVYDSDRERYDQEPNPLLRVIRGGNFADKPIANTQRLSDYPDAPREAKQRRDYEQLTLTKVGFRCAKDVD